MKHILDIIKENGYEPWRYSITFPEQNISAKSQNRFILDNKEKYNVFFVYGNEDKGGFYFKPLVSDTDFSTMRVGGIETYFVKDKDFENAIVWGLYEGGKPPTLIKPKLNIKYKRYFHYAQFDKEIEEELNGKNQDAIEKVLKEESHQFIFDNLYTNYFFEYDETKNPTE